MCFLMDFKLSVGVARFNQFGCLGAVGWNLSGDFASGGIFDFKLFFEEIMFLL